MIELIGGIGIFLFGFVCGFLSLSIVIAYLKVNGMYIFEKTKKMEEIEKQIAIRKSIKKDIK